VGLLSFTRYAIASVLRSRRRSLFAIVGIVLSLSLVSGSWIAVDSSGIGVLRAALDDYRVDFVASSSEGYVPAEGITEKKTGQAVDLMKSVEDVTSAAPLVSMNGWQFANASSGEIYRDEFLYTYGSLVFLSRNSTPILDAYAIDGALPDNGTVAIPNAMAKDLNISIGDSLTLSYVIYGGYYDQNTSMYVQSNSFINVSYPVSQIWTQDPDAQPYNYYYDYMGISDNENNIILRDASNPVVMNLVDLPQIMNAPNMSNYVTPYLLYYIWIDRDSVVRLGDLSGSVDRLQFIERQLNKKGYAGGFTVQESELLYPIMDVAPNLEMLKLLFLALSAPVMGLGVYLSIVGVDLGVTERRREFGILKSRGASNRQIRSSLLIEAVLLGAFAGVLGLLIGFGVSRPLMGSASTLFADSESQSFGTDFVISTWTVVLSILLGMGLMLLSSYRPYKRASKAEVSETLHFYTTSATQVQYKLRWDIVFLVLSGLSIFSVWLGLDAVSNVETTSWMVQMILIAIVIVGIVVFPLMPLFLTLGIIRPLTRGTKKLYSKFTLIVKPWTKDLHYLVDRNIVRNPRRASNLCVIISLALAFGIFISVTMESNLAFEKDSIRAEIGADIKVEGSRYNNFGTVDTDSSGLDAIRSIEGINSVAFYTEFSTYATVYSYGYLNAGISLIDPDDYAKTVRPGDFYFTDGGSEMLDELNTNGTALLENYWNEQFDLLVGDIIQVRIQWGYYDGNNYTSYEEDVPVLVAGFVKKLPGITNWNNMVYMDKASMSFINEENLTRLYAETSALIDVGKDVDQDVIGDQSVEIFEDAGFSASYKTKAGELARLNEDPFYGALSDFLYMEYLFSGTIMTAGVGLLIFVAVADREKELASIMARGSTGGQIRKILMGESITLMALGLVVGISVGLLSSYLFNTLLTTGMYGEVERRMVFSWVSGIVVVASVAALLIASLIATTRAGKIKLAEVLRIRGG
jgi:putative ABC transport system permease protein